MTRSPFYGRLLLGLHPGGPNREILGMVADLARALDLEVTAVLVEDSSIGIASALPSARELRLPSHEWLQADPERVAAELRAALEETRRHVAGEIETAGIACRLEIARGDPITTVVGLSSGEDIVVVPEPAHAWDFITGLARRLREAAVSRGSTVLLLPASPSSGRASTSKGPVLVAPNGGDLRAVSTGARLAVGGGRRLVLLSSDGGSEDDRLVAAAAASGLPASSIDIEPLTQATAGERLAAVEARRGSYLIGSRSLADLEAATTRPLASALGLPVLMLRPRDIE